MSIRIPKSRPFLPWLAMKSCEGKPMEYWDTATLHMIAGYWYGMAMQRKSGWRSMNYWYRKAHAEILRRRIVNS